MLKQVLLLQLLGAKLVLALNILELSKNGTVKTNFDELPCDRSLKLLVHGWMQTIGSPGYETIHNQLESMGDFPLLVEWNDTSSNLAYHAVNVELVSYHLAKYLQTNACQDYVECIGHSLGAHICGFIGRHFRKLRRIVALDAAGPKFDRTNSGLSQGDADYVLSLVTNCQQAGTCLSRGVATYYANDGRWQPGCNCGSKCPEMLACLLTNSCMSAIVGQGLFCSHEKSLVIFSNALSDSRLYQARSCNVSWGLFQPQFKVENATETVYFNDEANNTPAGTFCFTAS